MTITASPCRSTCDTDLAARFSRDVMPLWHALSRGARRLTSSDADAEDLLQETLLRAYAGFHNFHEGTNVQAWLFKILYNNWISGYRAKQRRPVETTEEAITDRVLARDTYPLRISSAEAEVLAAIPDADVIAALASLPDGFAEVLYLAMVDGYTYSDIAETLGVPLGTVMSRAHRGRQRLRVALAHRSSHSGIEDSTAQHVA